jgi:hypothetical protein
MSMSSRNSSIYFSIYFIKVTLFSAENFHFFGYIPRFVGIFDAITNKDHSLFHLDHYFCIKMVLIFFWLGM